MLKGLYSYHCGFSFDVIKCNLIIFSSVWVVPWFSCCTKAHDFLWDFAYDNLWLNLFLSQVTAFLCFLAAMQLKEWQQHSRRAFVRLSDLLSVHHFFVCHLFMFGYYEHTFCSVMSFETLHVIFFSAIYEHFLPYDFSIPDSIAIVLYPFLHVMGYFLWNFNWYCSYNLIFSFHSIDNAIK